MAQVEATGLTRVFASAAGGVHALRGVDLVVEAGEFVAVMGPSGCGKSTLLHLLGGLDRPTGGDVRLGGRSLVGLSERRLALVRRRQVGFVFQAYNLVPSLSVADNVELPALLAGASAAAARARRLELLDALGLAAKASVSPVLLSGGEQQRVGLARALVNEPELLLADEPTGNLDSAAGGDVIRLLRDSHGRGQTIVLVTHDARVAAAADRVVQMRDGQVSEDIAIVGPLPAPALSSLLYGDS